MNKLEIFLYAIKSDFWEIISIIVMLIIAAAFQRIIFLEYQTWDQMKKIIKACGICTIGIFTMIGLMAISSQYIPIFVVGLMIFVAIPFIYSGLLSRKDRRWLSFFEWIPLLGYLDGLLLLWDTFADNMLSKNIKLGAQIIVFSGIIVFLVFLLEKEPKFVRTLVSDIKNRRLSLKEEIIIWVIGIWLLVYDIAFRNKISEASPDFVVGYINVLNFLFAVGIVIFIINSNYRDYYYKKNINLQKSLISAMAELVENRDENTGGHIQRTSLYVEIIARKLQKNEKYKKVLTDDYIANMVIASPLHDVGKIHVPDMILNKPGKLDADEFGVMKKHAAWGGSIISRIEESTGDIEYLNIAKEMAEFHHERMDGNGYPYGMTGEEIPLCARILAVADVFDALVSKRCYKEPMPVDKAFKIIEEETGNHFDSDIAKAFLDSRAEVEKCMKMFD